jgi:hypothetical protein
MVFLALTMRIQGSMQKGDVPDATNQRAGIGAVWNRIFIT